MSLNTITSNTSLLFLLLIGFIAIPNVSGYNSEWGECVKILNSAKLEISNKQVVLACDDIVETGEAFIEGFKDRGLIIKFVTLGESVSIPLPSMFI